MVEHGVHCFEKNSVQQTPLEIAHSFNDEECSIFLLMVSKTKNKDIFVFFACGFRQKGYLTKSHSKGEWF